MKHSTEPQPTELVTIEILTGYQTTILAITENSTRLVTNSTESTTIEHSTRSTDLTTTESSTRSMVPLIIGVVAAAVIISGSVIIIIRSIKHHPKRTGELTFDSSGKLELTAIHSAGSMLNSYYASAENSSQHILKHDDDKNDHNYSVIESCTTPSGDGNPAPLYASIQEKVETREGSSTSEGREDTHTYSVVNTKENKSYTPEGQDDSHVYSVVDKKLAKEKANEEMDEQDEASVHKRIKISKEFPRPEGQDDRHLYSVVNKKLIKEGESTKRNEAFEEAKELHTPEGHIYSVITKERANEEMDESIETSVQKKTETPKELWSTEG